MPGRSACLVSGERRRNPLGCPTEPVRSEVARAHPSDSHARPRMSTLRTANVETGGSVEPGR